MSHMKIFYNVLMTSSGKFFMKILHFVNRAFRYFFDFLIIINAAFIAIDLDDADWFFLSIFTIEILCKLYVLGTKVFAKKFWNM